MTWTELDRESQDDIILRFSQGDDVNVLAAKYKLLPQSLSRKMRKLKSNGMFDYILNKQANKRASYKLIEVDNRGNKTPVVRQVSRAPETRQSNAFLRVVDSQKLYVPQPQIDFTFINQQEKPQDRMVTLDSDKEWSGIFFTDIHCPYEDPASVDAMLRVLKAVDHNIIINGGDNLDLYGLSVYAKDTKMLFQNHFSVEVEAHNRIMEQIGEASSAPKVSLYGNHMERYDKWMETTPFVAMGYLNNQLSLDAVLSMSYYGWHPFQGTLMFASKDNNIMTPKPVMVIDHGTRVKRGAGKSAVSQMKSYGSTSYVMGHVHRLGVNYIRTMHGQHCTAEGGTLRNLNPEYLRFPDWQNGMLHFTVHKDVVSITPILIEKGVAYVGNSKI